MIFYNYFICYFIILIFCFAETLKIFLYIIGITALRKNPDEKSTVPDEKSTEPSEKSTEPNEKSTEKAVYAVREKSTELVRKRRKS